jgi:hypothetical protein
MLSEAKGPDFFCGGGKQILRFAQDDSSKKLHDSSAARNLYPAGIKVLGNTEVIWT